MTYEVFITDPALADLEEAYLWLAGQTSLNAPLWYNGVVEFSRR